MVKSIKPRQAGDIGLIQPEPADIRFYIQPNISRQNDLHFFYYYTEYVGCVTFDPISQQLTGGLQYGTSFKIMYLTTKVILCVLNTGLQILCWHNYIHSS